MAGNPYHVLSIEEVRLLSLIRDMNPEHRRAIVDGVELSIRRLRSDLEAQEREPEGRERAAVDA